MDISIWNEDRRRKNVRLGIWLLAGIALLDAAVCTPVSLWCSNDVLLAESAFLAVWNDIAIPLIQFSYYWVAFAFLLYLTVRLSLRSCKKYLLGYAVCSAVRYLVQLIVSYLMLAGSDGWSEIGTDLLWAMLDILGDWLQMALVAWLTWRLLERRRAPDGKPPIRLERMFDFSQPLLRGILFAVAVPSCVRLLSRVYYDIFLGAAQSLSDLLEMIFFYCMDVISVLIGYLTVFLIINQLDIRDREAKLHAEQDLPSGDI